MSGRLLLFPGQGSQSPGMAEHLWPYPAARDTFAEAGEVLGWDIGELCRHGSMEELTRTDQTQLTILTCSVATWRLLEEQGVTFGAAAGHSLGEYSALVATGQMSFGDALRVVDVRGRAMHACGEERDGAMAAVIGLDGRVVDEICADLDEVWPANYNSPAQVVVSGSPAGVRAAGERAKERGAKRVLPLPVSGAFHTPFMAGAATSLAQALADVRFTDPAAGRGRFFSTTEVRYPAGDELAEVLSRQLISPVRFTQSIEALVAGDGEGAASREEVGSVEAAIEVGPGSVLCGLVRRIARHLPVAATADGESLGKVLGGWAAHA